MYHRIANDIFDPWGMCVSPAHFHGQGEWLARNRTVLPLIDFVKAHREGRLPADAVAITFDDGYACTFTVAAPILRQFDLPATVFVPAASLQSGGEFWWDELQRLVLRSDRSWVELDGRTIELGSPSERDFHWAPYDRPRSARQKGFRRLWSMIQSKRGGDVQKALTEIRLQLGGAGQPRNSHRIASIEEVRSRLSELDCGSHGLTHASLPALDSAAQRSEVEDSRTLLANLIGSSPRTFAFPFGNSNAEARRIVEEAGFLCACGSRQKFVTRDEPEFDLPRLVVENDGVEAFKRMFSDR